ncbi:MAG: hypothetical protein H7067_08060, partial [Burkholderiales bacterium]|nr:hypothetical protein [Opitutaceae bacterium]
MPRPLTALRPFAPSVPFVAKRFGVFLVLALLAAPLGAQPTAPLPAPASSAPTAPRPYT